MTRLTGLIACALFALSSFPLNAFGQEATKERPTPTAAQITKVLDNLYRSESSHSTVTMTVVNERGTRKLMLEQWSKGKDDALIVIRKPAREAGTATLMTKEGLWNYAPRADRLIRIPTGLLSDAWMGSHFTNDDLVRDSSYENDYQTEVAWSQLEGKDALKVTMTPAPDAPVIYTKVEFFVRPDDYVPLRADYYDEGKLMRRMEFEDIRDVGGRPIPHRMELIPMDKKGEKTVMQYDSLEFDVPVKDEIFSKRGLRRAAKR